jgi:predicted PP-loop superfamily ATPase
MDIYSAKTFSDAGQFLSELDAQIKQLEDLVKAVGAELEGLKPSLERYRRLQELLKRFSGGSGERSAPLEITGLQLYVDPNPMVMYEILEESYKHMVDLLSVLKKVQEVAQSVIREGGLESLSIMVQYKNGIPVKLIVTG